MDIKKKKILSVYIIVVLCIIGMIGLYIVRTYNPEKESFFIPCMFYLVTGIKCPRLWYD